MKVQTHTPIERIHYAISLPRTLFLSILSATKQMKKINETKNTEKHLYNLKTSFTLVHLHEIKLRFISERFRGFHRNSFFFL